ncbi:MAG: malto-oligosyltrehalose trehalohydrolase [Elusimicrobiota bacterium]
MSQDVWSLKMGANINSDNSVTFRVWAPSAKTITAEIVSQGNRSCEMQRNDKGLWEGTFSQVNAGDKYYYKINNALLRPDPVSRFQPDGVHGPSQIIDPNEYDWTDEEWKGIAIKDTIFYELHIGVFTRRGRFLSVIDKIPHLKKLGITCIELMPICQFPGYRNWGYDGVNLYAPQNTYGAPNDLKALINECHNNGIGVCLDVVYNHLGPEGNYLTDFGKYFTSKYKTPWGDAVNYDDKESAMVRKFIIDNALYWVSEYHIDMLRLDAVHTIFDNSGYNILEEINDNVQKYAEAQKRIINIIAESDLNDVKLIESKNEGGYGLAAQWMDDFHHTIHVALTGEKRGYYEDYTGLNDIAKVVNDNFVYDGKYSNYRKKNHGTDARKFIKDKFITCMQNHDQVGNRAIGDRLNIYLNFSEQKFLACFSVLTPFVPLLFMGQEYSETAPFPYFVDHGDKELIKNVYEGRKREFKSFGWIDDIPNPSAENTFMSAKLHWELISIDEHVAILKLYRDLIKIRKKMKIFHIYENKSVTAQADESPGLVIIKENMDEESVTLIFNFSNQDTNINANILTDKKEIILYTEAKAYGGNSNISDLNNITIKGKSCLII